MDYISSKEAAKLWGVDTSRIGKFAREGRIEGAKIVGRNWLIPKDAKKPADGRTKKARAINELGVFRFPLFVNSDEDAFCPALSEEEQALRKAELDFYMCNFDGAQKSFDEILKSTKNIYNKIISLFYLCSLSIEAYGGDNFLHYSSRLQLELTEDFPHKKDMEIVTPWLYTVMVQSYAVSKSLNIDLQYDYSPSVLPLISLLSFYHLSGVKPVDSTDIHLDVYEMLCREFQQNGHYYEACELRFLLFLACYVSMNQEDMLYHLRKALYLVKEHKFYAIAASYESYYQNAFDTVFEEFPREFADTVRRYSDIMGDSIGRFTKKYNITELFSKLSKNDYRYLIYAFTGKTNREIAAAMHVSQRTVANRYNEIYNKLGINSKQKLSQMLENSLS